MGNQQEADGRPECMTCAGASTEEIATQAVLHGVVPLCHEHTEVLISVARDKEVEGPHLNPDCEAGKHAACRGDAWCFVEDTGVSCGCSCHDGEVDRG